VWSKHQLRLAWRFLAAWLGEETLWPGDPPYDLCAELAFRHRLEPLLGSTDLPDDLPAALTTHFKDTARTTRAAQIERFARVQSVLAVLESWPVIVFKGFAAAELLYPDIGARSMGDVDLLVCAKDFGAARRALLNAGFQQEFVGHPVLDDPAHHEREFSNGSLTVDLHQGFTQPYRVAIDYDQVFARSLPWTALAPNARILSPEHAVLAQVIHQAIGELTPQAAPVIGLWDLRLMLQPRPTFWRSIETPPLDLDSLRRLAIGCGAERMVYAVLALASLLFPSLAAAFESQKAIVTPRVRRTLDLLVRRAFPPPLLNPSRLEMIARKVGLLPPRSRRALLARQLPLRVRHRMGRLLGHFE
jgi:hypothetical protein